MFLPRPFFARSGSGGRSRRPRKETRVPKRLPPPPKEGVNTEYLGSFIQEVMRDIGVFEISQRASEDFDAIRPMIDKLIPWLGGRGLLIEARIARRIHDPNLPAALRVVYVYPRVVGVNADEAALKLAMAEKPESYLPLVPDGFRTDWERSFYLWVTESKIDIIDYPKNKDLFDDAVRQATDIGLAEEFKRQHEIEGWRAMNRAATTARARLDGVESFERLTASYNQALDRLTEIESRLREALERERRVAEVRQWLDVAATGMDLAGKLGEVARRLRTDAPPSPLDIKSEQALREYIQSIQVRVTEEKTTLEQQVIDIRRDKDGVLQQWNTEAGRLEIPNIVRP